MRDINRIRLISERLEKIWMKNPDFRLTQLIIVIGAPSITNPELFYLEDDIFLQRLENFETKCNEDKVHSSTESKKHNDKYE
ncbi:hypothetical protein LJC30_06540 [Odoribacter sp. OttesenSCG-928-L07]|nr:hypothetical protein [Odoribacter sp. OttesenSCG-928-L07]MDL2238766.1 hypothetical protein [Bacteroidales bacterium OttesenSCG-928-L14]MDL2241187.1 hypothetical protein [Bacteroidales bacterium OttesenSCG-928-K22]